MWVLTNTLNLHIPSCPFVTEEIWQSLPHQGEALIVAGWPEYEESPYFPGRAEMKKVMELITAVRTRRSEMNVPPSKKAHLAMGRPRTRPPLCGAGGHCQPGLLQRRGSGPERAPRPRAA